ncbi:MAG TPA: MFS transporter [Nitriliruptoraceae bacterium]|nr:MFS transporter [Nitriliruptoraceae bacterium]
MSSRRGLLAFVFTVTLTGILNNTLVTPAIPDILADFGQPDSRSGWLVATGSVAGIIVAPIVGVLADRFGRRIVLTSCLAVFATFGTAAALAPSFEFLLVARLLQGFGSAGLVNLAVVLLGDNFTGAARTHWVGRNAAVLTLGLAALPSVSGFLTEAFSWRVAFGLYTIGFVTAIIAWNLLKADRPADPPLVRDQLTDVAVVVRQPPIAIILVLGFFLFVVLFGAFLTVMPLHLANVFGLEAAARGLILSSPAITSSISAFNLGRIRRRLSMRTLAMLACTVFTVAFIIMGLAAAVWMLLLGTLGYGTSEGMLIGGLQDEAMAIAPEQHRGAIVAAWVGAARLGQTAGPLIAGGLLAVTTTNVALLAAAAMTFGILCLAAIGPLRRTTEAPGATTT